LKTKGIWIDKSSNKCPSNFLKAAALSTTLPTFKDQH
jgi:hypothetical protein